MADTAAETIRQYYDRLTPRFVALGQRGSHGALHRAVWAPGVKSARGAFRYVEDEIAKLLQRLPTPLAAAHVVDLGCGVGASLCHLAERLPVRATGVTVSPVQARLARRRLQRAGIADRVRCVEADFCDLPHDVAPADLAFAIESFAHVADPVRFFTQCRGLVRPGGLLVICDDFQRCVDDGAAALAVESFRRGWHINTLIDRERLRTLARTAGFEHELTQDLSPYLHLRRVRDRLIDVLLALARWQRPESTRDSYLSGGSALQSCLERGWIGYDLAVFRRLEPAERPSPRTPSATGSL